MWLHPARKIGVGQDLPATRRVIVDERFVVIADSQALRQEALARRGGESAVTLLDLVDVPPQAVELMVHRCQPPPRRPDRQPSPPWQAMVRSKAPVAHEWFGPAASPNLPGPPIHETRRGIPVWSWRQVDGEEGRMELSALWQHHVALTFGPVIFL